MMLIYGCQFLLFRYEKRKRKKFISELITWDVMEGAPSLFRERCDGEGERKKWNPSEPSFTLITRLSAML